MAVRAKVMSGTAEKGNKEPLSLWSRDFILICIHNIIVFVCYQMLISTVPIYVNELGGSDAVVGLATACFMVAALLMRPWVGRGLDLYGRTGIWFTGAVIFALLGMVYNWAVTIPLLMVCRAVHGASWSVVTTASATAATDLIPPARRGEGMGFFGLGNNVGMAIGPALGFVIIAASGFGALFWSSAALSLLALLLIFAIRLPCINEDHSGAAPAFWEPTALKPSLLMFFAAFIYSGVLTFIALYSAELGLSDPWYFFTVYAVTIILIRPLAGFLFDRCGQQAVIAPGFLLLGTGMIILSCATGLTSFLLAAILTGMGFGTLHPSLQALAVAVCAPNRRGAAQATFAVAFDIGMGGGALALGLVARFGGYSGAYLVSGVIALIGLFVYRLIGLKVEVNNRGNQVSK